MMKRFLCALMAAVMLVGMAAFAVPKARAESNMTASEELIELIKQFEGFIERPVWDYKQYSMGYGTVCHPDELQHYLENGITREEADERLRNHVNAFSAVVNRFIDTYGTSLTQQQFDAMVSLSYNCGTDWEKETEGVLHNALKSGATGNDLLYAFSLWSYTNNVPNDGLIKRRLAEAELYLNGVYSTAKPANYTYVKFDGNGCTLEYHIQGYKLDEPTHIRVPVNQTYTSANADGTASTYTFDGWYTAKIGGAKVETLDSSLAIGTTLYAHWRASDGTVVEPTPPVSTPVDGIEVTVTGTDVNVRGGPGTDYSITGRATKGDKLTITETSQNGGYLWGKFGEDKWIALSYTNYDSVKDQGNSGGNSGNEGNTGNNGNTETPPPAQAVTGVVTVSDHLNIRSGAGTHYEKVGEYAGGAKVTILEQKTVGADVWGRTDKGWISMAYVKLDSENSETQTPPVTQPPVTQPPETQPHETQPPVTQPAFEPWVGTVKVGDKLTIRSGAGIYNSIKGFLINGAEVTILEETTVGDMKWGRIENGWISLNYVVPGAPEKDPEPTQPVEPTIPEQTTPVEPPKPITQLDGKWAGKVNTADVLYLRRDPGCSGEVTGNLVNGTSLTITQIKTLDSKLWGKVDKGWICLDYVTMDTQIEAPEQDPDASTTGTITLLKTPMLMTVNTCSLRVRSGASVTNKIVGYVAMGSKVEIVELRAIGSKVWGRTADGWVDMKYLLEE